jgi:hypothetical protein
MNWPVEQKGHYRNTTLKTDGGTRSLPLMTAIGSYKLMLQFQYSCTRWLAQTRGGFPLGDPCATLRCMHFPIMLALHALDFILLPWGQNSYCRQLSDLQSDGGVPGLSKMTCFALRTLGTESCAMLPAIAIQRLATILASQIVSTCLKSIALDS